MKSGLPTWRVILNIAVREKTTQEVFVPLIKMTFEHKNVFKHPSLAQFLFFEFLGLPIVNMASRLLLDDATRWWIVGRLKAGLSQAISLGPLGFEECGGNSSERLEQLSTNLPMAAKEKQCQPPRPLFETSR
ncbi:hypothetical protein TNCV_3044861 [Trichonephila clavipes]|nr:hypothetical protein TNCV_3044861 [Trichonephila clavipes]